jgi:galactofuranose transport system permease protein
VAPKESGLRLRIAPGKVPLIATVTVFAILYGVASMRYPNFFTWNVFRDLLRDNAFLGLAAVGMTFVILSGGIDLSVGAVIGFTSILVGTLVTNRHVPPMAAMGLALAAGTTMGAVMGWLIGRFMLPPFLVTLAGMFFARGLGFIISVESVSINNPLYDAIGANPYSTPILFLVVLGIGLYLAHYRPFGRAVYAIGGSESSALLMGVPILRTKVGVYALSGFCAALAGVVHTLYMSSGNASAGTMLELDAIAAVVIGGTLLTGGVGHLLGTLIGVLILGVIQTVISFESWNSWWTRIAVGGLLLLFILLQRLLRIRDDAVRAR